MQLGNTKDFFECICVSVVFELMVLIDFKVSFVFSVLENGIFILFCFVYVYFMEHYWNLTMIKESLVDCTSNIDNI